MTEETLRELERRARAYFLRMKVPAHEADDLVQEVLLRIHRGAEPSRDPLPLLYTIARNERIRWQTRRGRRRIIELQIHPGIEKPQQENPEEILEQKNQYEALRAALESIDEPTREILVLKHFQNLSFQEVGLILSLPPSTVKSKVYKALTHLKRRLR